MDTQTQDQTYNQALTRVVELEAELQQLKTRNQQLTAFQQMSEAVSASLNIEQVLDAILKQIARVVSFDSATLMLVEREQLRAVAARGFAGESLALNVYPRSSRNLAWRVVQRKAPSIIADVQSTADWESREGLEHIRGWMGVPLIVKNQVIGVLTLNSRQSDAYTPEDAQVIFSLAYQVAIAVENASLFERLRTQRDHMTALQDLNQAIASVLDLGALLQVIMQQMAQMLGSSRCALWLFDKTGQTATIKAWYGPEAKYQHPSNSTFNVVRHPLMQQMLIRNEPLVISKIDAPLDGTGWDNTPASNFLLAAPLCYKDKNIGFVVTDNTEEREAFLPDHLALAMNAANQAALSIRAVKLFDELQKQADRLRLINEVSQQLTTVLNVGDLFGILAQVIYERLHYLVVAIFEIDSADERVVLKAVTGHSPSWLLPNEYWQPLNRGAIGVVAGSGRTLVVNDVQERPHHAVVDKADFRSGLVTPIYINKSLAAFLTVHSDQKAAFDENDVWTLETLGQQAAIAIENARLYRDTAQRLSDLGVLHDAGQALISTLDLDEVLAIIMARTCDALFAEYGYALLTNEAKTALKFVATVGSDAWLLKGRTIPLIGSVMGTVVKQGKTLLINDTASLPQFFVEIDSHVKANTHSLMVAPLKTKGEILGALLVTNKQGDRFTRNNLNLLVSLAQLASGAIENARLFRQVQQYSQNLEAAVAARTVHLTAVNRTSRDISSIVFVDELFARVTQLISELFNRARVSVGLRTGNYLTFQKIFDGEFEAGSVPANYRLRIDKDHILGRVLLRGEADLVETVGTAELYRLDDDEEAPATALVVPLTIGGKTTGIIVVQTRSWLASQQQDLETLASVASQVAVAMENARLLQKSREMAIEQERTRLARDIHDGVAQNLAYLLIQVDRCLLMSGSNNLKLNDELENISQVIARNIEELRRHIFDLRPVGLENRSIYRALRQTTGEFGDQTGLESSCEIIGDEVDLTGEVESSLYRIFQEALSNIRRHAQCSRVDVVLRTHPDKSVEFSIEDDGMGFDPAHLTRNPFQRHGLGLISMQERIRSLGGTLTIDSAPGRGARIRVNVPAL